MTAETWKPIPGWEGYYEASDQARIRSVDRTVVSTAGVAARRKGRIIASRPSKVGYLLTNLSRDGGAWTFTHHRLIAATFLGPCPDGLIVCHNDGNRQNNVPSNLRYDTYSANELDSVAHGTHSEARKTHCPQGHAYDSTNTRYQKNGRSRRCIACDRARSKSAYRRRVSHAALRTSA